MNLQRVNVRTFLLVNTYSEIKTSFFQDTARENKLRLLMIVAAIYPEKFEGEKGLNIMKVGLLVIVYQP